MRVHICPNSNCTRYNMRTSPGICEGTVTPGKAAKSVAMTEDEFKAWLVAPVPCGTPTVPEVR